MGYPWKMTLILLFVILGYLAFGGWIFSYLEKNDEDALKQKLKALYKNITSTKNSCVNVDQVLDYVKTILGPGTDITGNSSGIKWDYDGAFFFSFTAVTTIGYGALAPATQNGRIAFIIYGLLGIPLFLSLLNHIGNCSKILHTKLQEKYPRWHRIVSIFFYIKAAAMLFFIPCFVVSHFEQWSYVESIYFGFQTFTTIGFGDLVPGQGHAFPKPYRAFIIIWVTLGLAYMTTLMSFLYNLDAKAVETVVKWQDERSQRKTTGKNRVMKTKPDETWHEYPLEGEYKRMEKVKI